MDAQMKIELADNFNLKKMINSLIQERKFWNSMFTNKLAMLKIICDVESKKADVILTDIVTEPGTFNNYEANVQTQCAQDLKTCKATVASTCSTDYDACIAELNKQQTIKEFYDKINSNIDSVIFAYTGEMPNTITGPIMWSPIFPDMQQFMFRVCFKPPITFNIGSYCGAQPYTVEFGKDIFKFNNTAQSISIFYDWYEFKCTNSNIFLYCNSVKLWSSQVDIVNNNNLFFSVGTYFYIIREKLYP